MHMKKNYNVFLIVLAFIGLTAFHPITDPFEGTVRYETTTTGDLPAAIADKLSRYYEASFHGGDMKLTGDGPTKGQIILSKKLSKMFILRTDQKNVYEMDFNDPRVSKNSLTSKVTKADETMTIAGYACEKYQIQYSNGIKINVWTTQKISVSEWGESTIFNGLLKLPVDGFPMQIQFISPTFSITSKALDVKSGTVNAASFEVPKDFTSKKI